MHNLHLSARLYDGLDGEGSPLLFLFPIFMSDPTSSPPEGGSLEKNVYISPENHRLLKIESATLGMSLRDTTDKALEFYFKNKPAA